MAARRAAIVLVAALVALLAGACGPAISPAETALAAFVELAARPDLAYRFMATSRALDGNPGGEATAEGIVVGRDSTLTVTAPRGEDFAVVIKGDRFFRRSADGSWEERGRDAFESNDLSFLLPLVGGAELAPGQTVTFEDQRVHQLGNLEPISLPTPGGGGLGITRVEVLVDDSGRPVRLVAELVRGDDVSTPMALIEIRFTDVGAVLAIETPDVR